MQLMVLEGGIHCPLSHFSGRVSCPSENVTERGGCYSPWNGPAQTFPDSSRGRVSLANSGINAWLVALAARQGLAGTATHGPGAGIHRGMRAAHVSLQALPPLSALPLEVP